MTREEIDQAAKIRYIEAQHRDDTWHDEMAAFAIEQVNQALEEAANKIDSFGVSSYEAVQRIRALKIKDES